MNCRTCQSSENVEACLFCGHGCCALHRGQLDGATACSGCVQAEHERIQAARRAPAPQSRPRPPASSSPGPIPTAAPAPAKVSLEPRPEPVPASRGWLALGLALLAAICLGGYLHQLFAYLVGQRGFPAWSPLAAGLASGVFAFLGVWVIAKTKLAPADGLAGPKVTP